MMSGMVILWSIMAAGGGNELLDLMHTDSYWAIKGVEATSANMRAEFKPVEEADAAAVAKLIGQLGHDDFKVREAAQKKLLALGPAIGPQLKKADLSDPEVSTRVQQILDQFGKQAAAGKAAQVRKLMAIRTVGEKKFKDAEPELKKLLESKEPFVADYARTALARLAGQEPAARPLLDAKTRASDVKIMPAGLCLIAQAVIPGTAAKPNMEQTVDRILELEARTGNEEKLSDEAAAAKAASLRQVRDTEIRNFTQQVLNLAEQIGNFRAEGVTLSVSDKLANNAGFAVIVARGKYDSAAVRAFLKASMQGPGFENMPPEFAPHEEMIEGVPVYTWFGGMPVLAFPSDEQLIFAVGNHSTPLSIKEILSATKSGQGDFGKDEAMAKLLKGVDQTAPLWGAMNFPPFLKQQLRDFTSLDTIVLQSQAKGKDLLLTVSATTSGEMAAQEFATTAQGWIKTAQAAAGNQGGQAALGAEVAQLIKSLNFKADGGTVTGSGVIAGHGIQGLMLLPEFFVEVVIGGMFRPHAGMVQPMNQQAQPPVEMNEGEDINF